MSKIEVNLKDFYINFNLNPNLYFTFVEIKVESFRNFLKVLLKRMVDPGSGREGDRCCSSICVTEQSDGRRQL